MYNDRKETKHEEIGEETHTHTHTHTHIYIYILKDKYNVCQ